MDGDSKISRVRPDLQDERKRELETARELTSVEGTGLRNISLNRPNQYVQALNQGGQIETLKPTVEDAGSLLDRKRFIDKEDKVTTLGMLVCGEGPERWLLSRCHLDGFVSGPVVMPKRRKHFVTMCFN